MLVAAALIVAAGLLCAAALVSSTEPGMRSRLRRRCLVACKDGQSFEGVLWASDRGCLVLKNASIVGEAGATAMDGEVVILRVDVAFLQLP